jgi:hypothetical protein
MFLVGGVVLAIALGLFFVFDNDSTSAGGSEATAADDGIVAAAAFEGSTCAGGRSYYVAPSGKAEATGSINEPLDLVTALSEKSPAKPCDTVWLRGGTYKGTFTSALKGSEGKPIIVRQHPEERATIDGAGSAEPALQVRGAWTWYWGFEVTNSDTKRASTEPGPWPSDLRRGTGVGSRGTNIKFINLIVHDGARGFEVPPESVGTEIYGSLIYYNGWETPGGLAQGNGIDTQNDAGVRRIANNIIFDQFSHGIIASGKTLNSITIDGNTIFSNGSISRKGVLESRNVLLGAGVPANDPVFTDNAIYDGQINLGYDAGCANATIERNYFAGPLVWVKCAGTMKGNFLYNPYESASGYTALAAQNPDNTYAQGRPTGVVVRVRKNEYEPGEGMVTIYNWDKQPKVSVNLAEIGLKDGDRFEIRDAQNYFGDPVVSDTYAGEAVEVPMDGTTITEPVGVVPVAPKHTHPEFGVFVIVKLKSKAS